MTIGTSDLATYIAMNEPYEGLVQERPSFSNIDNGLEWLKLNKAIALDKILKGQKYVNEFYSPESVSQLWRKIINKVLI